MFQFGRFPAFGYVFTKRLRIMFTQGFPIRTPAARSLFAAPRGFSQLIASFFGSWRQGIHLMLFLAWTLEFREFFFLIFFPHLQGVFSKQASISIYARFISTSLRNNTSIIAFQKDSVSRFVCFSRYSIFSFLFGFQCATGSSPINN